MEKFLPDSVDHSEIDQDHSIMIVEPSVPKGFPYESRPSDGVTLHVLQKEPRVFHYRSGPPVDVVSCKDIS